MQATEDITTNRTLTAAVTLTLLSAVRAMTLGWIGRAGDGGNGDPPAAWLMPLIGDAAVGLSALIVAYLLWTRRTPGTWAAAIAWSSVAAFDAIAAYLVDIQTPWPDFFMIEIFGRSMFFAAAGMHVVIISLLLGRAGREPFGV